MKNILAILFVISALFSFGQTMKMSTENAYVYFNYVSEATKGTLKGVQAKIALDPSNLASSAVSGRVGVESLSTGDKMRDKHLKSEEFFHVEKYPAMSFVTSEIVMNGDKMEAKGKLTIKDVTKDVTFKVSETDEYLVFKTTIYSMDYGIAIKKGREKSKVHIAVKIPLN